MNIIQILTNFLVNIYLKDDEKFYANIGTWPQGKPCKVCNDNDNAAEWWKIFFN
jgi:hypothetical protein